MSELVKTYTESSREFAKGAIRIAVLLNSGAIIAVLNQLSELSKFSDFNWIKGALLAWVTGAMLGALSSIKIFQKSLRMTEEAAGSITIRKKEAKSHDVFDLSILLILFSLLMFSAGSIGIMLSLSTPPG